MPSIQRSLRESYGRKRVADDWNFSPSLKLGRILAGRCPIVLRLNRRAAKDVIIANKMGPEWDPGPLSPRSPRSGEEGKGVLIELQLKTKF